MFRRPPSSPPSPKSGGTASSGWPAAFRLFARFGYDEGVAGHITARDPGNPDRFWVNPFGVHFGQIRVSDLILVDDKGEVVRRRLPGEHRCVRDPFAGSRGASGRGGGGARALDVRQGVVLARPPARSDHAGRLRVLRRPRAVRRLYRRGVRDVAKATASRKALGSRKAVILRNHGLLTVGRTVDEAAWWFITMERSCQAQLLAEAAGKPIQIAHEHAITARNQVGNEYGGWFQFQPLWQKIAREEPDLFE